MEMHKAFPYRKWHTSESNPMEMYQMKGIRQEDKTMDIFKCKKCGTMVEEIKHGGCHPSCCGEPMEYLDPGTSDGAHEKHVPVISVDGTKVVVCVGEVEHPMVDVHYIEWIAIETTMGVQKKALKPEMAPKAEFVLLDGEQVTAAYAYCNLHGLWKSV